MRLVIQRVLEAGVKVDGEFISKIGPGICILLGLHKGDSPELVDKWADKALKLKLWPEIENLTEEQKESNSPKGKGGWKTSVIDNNYSVLVVSNFTLYGVLKGNKPDFHSSMSADEARELYERFLSKMQERHSKEKVQGGMFQTYMNVHLVNDGPVTLCLDADENSDSNNSEKQQKKKEKEELSGEKKIFSKSTENLKQKEQHEQKERKEISEEQRQRQLDKQQKKKALKGKSEKDCKQEEQNSLPHENPQNENQESKVDSQ